MIKEITTHNQPKMEENYNSTTSVTSVDNHKNEVTEYTNKSYGIKIKFTNN
jgi:hypothetical protein